MVDSILPGAGTGGRGQVGIETLIVFVAMILVAAVGAGVLLDTAGVLQSRASNTGQESQRRVSNNVGVISATGTVNGSENVIETVDVVVMPLPGSTSIDLRGITVQWIGPGGERTLTYDDATADTDHFAVTSLNDDDGSVPVLNERSDRFDVVIHAGDAGRHSAPEGLSPGESATVKLTTEAGSTCTVVLHAPDTLVSYEDGVEVPV